MFTVYKSFVFTIFFFISYGSIAQSSFSPGYILTLAGDTLKGTINDKGWEINPRKIQFIDNATAAAENYFPHQIQGFFVSTTNEFYRSAIAKIDYTPHKVDEVVELKQLMLHESDYVKTDTVFLRELARGKSSLYILKDKGDKVHYFVSKQSDATVTELINRAYRVNNQLAYSLTYRTQLVDFLQGSPKALQTLKTADYTTKDLQKLILLNNGTEAVKVKHQNDKEQIQFYVTAGVSKIQPGLTSIFTYPSKFQYSTNPTAGLGLNLTIPRSKNRLNLYNEVSFKTYTSKSEYDYLYAGSISRTQIMNVSASYVKWNGLVRYKLSTGSWQPFVQAGITIGLNLQRSDSYKERYSADKYTTERSLFAFEGWQKMDYGWIAGAGVHRKRLVLEVRYERIADMTHSRNTTLTGRGWFVLIGYRIK